MSQDRTAEVSEVEIAVHWQEEAYVHPPEKFVAQCPSRKFWNRKSHL